MALTTYDYDKDNLDLTVLSGEILESSITNVESELDGTEDTGEATPTENLHITFLNALSGADETTLDGLVSAHNGTPMPMAADHSKVLSRVLTAPPGDPALRDSYIIASVATGAWAGNEDCIAVWAKSMWEFGAPAQGITAFVVDEALTVSFDTTDEWTALSAKRKINATAAPASTDDGTEGYSVGSLWVDVTADKSYICVDSTTSAAVWKETTGSAGAAHALGGVDHTADTLANLNSKVSDATLIDTGDSRLSDSRVAVAHALGGAEHTADTLAKLNTLVSDATLIDTGDSRLSDARTPTTHTHGNADLTGVPGAGVDTTAVHDDTSGEINAVTTKATPVSADVLLLEDSAASFAKKKITVGSLPASLAASSIAEASGDTTETSATDVLVASMTLTPAAGTYAVTFTSSVELSANNSAAFFSIYSAGSQVAASERKAQRGAGQGDVGLPFTCAAKVTVNGSQAIEGQVRVSAGTATIHQRTLMIVEVAP